MKSMTGYGRAMSEFSDIVITVEMKSVNNRYLDVNIKCPRGYAFIEDPMKKLLQKHLSRGKVDVFVTLDMSAAGNVSISLNKPLLDAYLSIFSTLETEYSMRNSLSVTDIMRLPDVLVMTKTEADEALFLQAVLDTLLQAIAAYNTMRTEEGAAMQADISSRIATLESQLSAVEAYAPQTVIDYQAKLSARMSEILSGVPLDEQRILTEAAFFADKVSVAEEVVRLRSHFSQFLQMLADKQPVGRKLDFLVQELNREVNTIGSKCTDMAITKTVVDMKAEIEKIREQIQNIE